MIAALIAAAALGQCQPGQACYRPAPAAYSYALPYYSAPVVIAPQPARYAPAVYRPAVQPPPWSPYFAPAPACRPGQACYRPR